MDIINQNPYRVIGILAAATEREIQRRKSKIQAYSKVGKKIESEYDFSFFKPINRNEETIGKAFSALEKTQDKVMYALFWFLNNNAIDDIAIEHLKNQSPSKSGMIWQRVTKNVEINENNFSAFNNISTLRLSSGNTESIRKGIEIKIKLINSVFFKKFAESVSDQTFVLNRIKQQENFLDIILSYLKKNLSEYEILNIFNECPQETQKYIINKITAKPINEIESLIEHCEKERKQNSRMAVSYGTALYKASIDKLSFLESTLGSNDLNYKMMADRVAKEIILCADDYYEAVNDEASSKLVNTMTELLGYAQLVAACSQILETIENKIEQIERIANEAPMLAAFKEMQKHLEALDAANISIDSVDTVINNCKNSLNIINNMPNLDSDLYLTISSNLVMHVLNTIIDIVNEAQTGLEGNTFKQTQLPIVASKAVLLMGSLDSLEMDSEARARFNKNYFVIKDIEVQMKKITQQSGNSSLSAGFIIFWIIVVIIVISLSN